MRRPGVQLSPELLLEETRFILKTLLRDDLFGSRVRLTDAERVLDRSISLSFADYTSFLSRHGYVRVDGQANLIDVTDQGQGVVRNGDDSELATRLGQHFAKELGSGVGKAPSAPPAPRSPAPSAWSDTSVVRARAMAPPSELAPAPGGLEDVLDRRYRRGAVLGAGPVGAVYEGEHIALARRVAIKEARSIFQLVSYLRRDEIVSRFRHAVQLQASLLHPGIVQVLDHNYEREYPYMVMELAKGGNLRQRMNVAEDGRLDLSVAIRILLQIGYAVQFAHEKGIPHLGLKPENVLFDGLGNVKLSDFSLTRVLDREGESTQAPVLISSGTVAYMAPERLQTDGEAKGGPAADIYSMGILCYEMLTGKLPGRRSPLPSQVRKEIPSAFDDVFDKMTRDELDDRYSSMDEVLAGLYKAFPNKEVHTRGTILMWAEDPTPLPEREPEPAPEPDEIVEEGTVDEARLPASEATTGEFDTRAR